MLFESNAEVIFALKTTQKGDFPDCLCGCAQIEACRIQAQIQEILMWSYAILLFKTAYEIGIWEIRYWA